MTPTQAGEIMRQARAALRRGLITHHEFVLLDCLLWSCRPPGGPVAVMSYTGLQRLARMARATVWRGLRRLEELGVITRRRRRMRVGWASLQATSAYGFHAPTEFTSRPVYRVDEKKRRLTGKTLAVLAAKLGLGLAPHRAPNVLMDGAHDLIA